MKIPNGFIKTKYRLLYINKQGDLFFSSDHPNAKQTPTLYTDRDGYFRIWVTNNKGERKFVLYHRVLMETFSDKKFHHLTVNHIDGNKKNNDFKNLEWASVVENLKHQHRIVGVNYAFGERHGGRKINQNQAMEILESSADIKSLAKKYNISISQIIRIKSGKNWSCLKR